MSLYTRWILLLKKAPGNPKQKKKENIKEEAQGKQMRQVVAKFFLSRVDLWHKRKSKKIDEAGEKKNH